MTDLGQSRISKQGSDQLQDILQVQLAGQQFTLLITMTAGNIPGLVCIHTHGDSDKFCYQRVKRGCFSIHHQPVCASQLIDQFIQLFPFLNEHKLVCVNPGGRNICFQQGKELQLSQNRPQSVRIGFLYPVRCRVFGHLGVIVQANKIPGHESIITVINDSLFHF